MLGVVLVLTAGTWNVCQRPSDLGLKALRQERIPLAKGIEGIDQIDHADVRSQRRPPSPASAVMASLKVPTCKVPDGVMPVLMMYAALLQQGIGLYVCPSA